MKYTIRHAKNGWIATAYYGSEKVELVGVEGASEAEAFIEFLRNIIQESGPTTGKYSMERVHVLRIPGNCYEGELSTEYRAELEDYKQQIEGALQRTTEVK